MPGNGWKSDFKSIDLYRERFMRWKKTIYGTLAFVALFCITLTLHAQGSDAGGGGKSLWQILQRGGLIALLIGILSLLAGGLVVKYIIDLQKDNLVPPEIVGEVDRLLQEEEYAEALSLCEMEPSVFTNIVAEGIAKINMSKDELNRAIDDAKEAEHTRIQNQISWLSLIGNIAPMLGLLGTVIGMISAFREIAQNPNPSPSQLADGIYAALVTTALGLLLAIPVLSCYFYFRNRVSEIFTEVELMVEDIFDQIHMQR